MSKISLLFENYSPMKVIYLLIRFKKKELMFLCSFCETMNTDRNGENEQN